MNQKKLLGILFLLLFVSGLFYQVTAYSNVTVTLNSSVDKKIEYPNQAQIYLPNGYYAYAYPKFAGTGTNSYIYVNLYSQTGTLITTFSCLTDLYFAGSSSPYRYSFSLALYNSSTLQLWIARCVTTGGPNAQLEIDVWLLNTVTIQTVKINLQLENAASPNFPTLYPRLSKIFSYGGKFYAVLGCPQYGVANLPSRLYQLEFDGVTIIKMEETVYSGHVYTSDIYPSITHAIHCVQDNNNTNMLYMMFGWEHNSTRPYFYAINLLSSASEELAIHPLTDVLSVNRTSYFLGGGIEYNGDYIYLYWTWTSPFVVNASYKYCVITQHRLVFNLTISASNLLAQNSRTIYYYPNLPSGTEPFFTVGYMIDKDSFMCYMPNSYGGSYFEYEVTIELPDWFNYASTSITGNAEELPLDGNEPIPFTNDWDIIGRLDGGTYQSNEQNDLTVKLFYGLAPITQDWDITLSYTPYDIPPITKTKYTYTVTTFLNDIGTQTVVFIYLDNGYITSNQTASNGVYQFSLTLGIAGVHNITVKAYSNNTLRREETFSYTWIPHTETNPTTETLIVTLSGFLSLFLPVMIMVVVPSLVFSKVAGIAGFIFGACIGVIMSFMVGLLPIYAVYLTFIIVGVAVVLVVKGGGEGE